MATATDDFNRANGAPGANWSGSVDSDLAISSNRITGAVVDTTCSMYYSAFTPASCNYYVKAKTYSNGSGKYNGVCVGMSATRFFVMEVDPDGSGFSFYDNNNGTWFKLGTSFAGSVADGDVIEIQKYGIILIGLVNGVERLRVACIDLPEIGFGGIYINSNSSQMDDFEIGDLSEPSFPYPADAARTNGTTLSGGAALTMPSGIVAGEILFAVASNDNTGGTNMAISGWTEIFHTQFSGNVVSLGAWAKVAAGGDTATLTGASQDYAAIVMRIKNHGVSTIATDIKVGTAATGTDAAPNPPSLDAGSAANRLWFAINGSDDDDEQVEGSEFKPTNYAGIYPQVESAQSTTSTMLQAALRINNTQTEDPGTFTLGAVEEWIAQTIGIPPAGSTPTSLLVDDRQRRFQPLLVR